MPSENKSSVANVVVCHLALEAISKPPFDQRKPLILNRLKGVLKPALDCLDCKDVAPRRQDSFNAKELCYESLTYSLSFPPKTPWESIWQKTPAHERTLRWQSSRQLLGGPLLPKNKDPMRCNSIRGESLYQGLCPNREDHRKSPKRPVYAPGRTRQFSITTRVTGIG
jgi:hypothetical protein